MLRKSANISMWLGILFFVLYSIYILDYIIKRRAQIVDLFGLNSSLTITCFSFSLPDYSPR